MVFGAWGQGSTAPIPSLPPAPSLLSPEGPGSSPGKILKFYIAVGEV